MINMHFRIAFLALGFIIACSHGASCRTFTPREDTQAVLHNPDMGWVVYENYPIDQRPGGASNMVVLPDEAFPEADEVAIMFSWYDVEKSRGNYDFSKVDRAYDYWKARCKKIQLRMSTESLLFWSALDPPAGKGIPDYVLNVIAQAKKQVRSFEQFSYTVVDAREPFYQSRLRNFLRAVAKHFKTRPVSLIDLRGFGLWGEWHSGYKYATIEDRYAALKSIIDCWSTELEDYTLAISFSYDPDSPQSYYAGPNDHLDPAFTKNYHDFIHYSAFDYAVTKPNITLRRDGAGGAIHSNERKLCESAFGSLNKGPIVAEFLGGYSQAKKGGDKWVRWMVDDALSIHPNYICLLGWQGPDARDFCREQPDLIRYGLLNMGYRLVPVEVTVPDKIRSAATCRISMKWVNKGMGKAMRDYSLIVALSDPASGKIVRKWNLGPMQTSKWIKGKTYHVDKQFAAGTVRPGSHVLLISMLDPKDGKPIGLPLKSARKDGFYRIGTIDSHR